MHNSLVKEMEVRVDNIQKNIFKTVHDSILHFVEASQVTFADFNGTGCSIYNQRRIQRWVQWGLRSKIGVFFLGIFRPRKKTN